MKPKIVDAYPLSSLQLGFLFRYLYENDTDMYFVQNAFSLEHINSDYMRQAWNIVANRHDVLKSAIIWKGIRDPIACVLGKVEIPFEEYNWNSDDKISMFVSNDRNRGFDLSRAPLMRIALIHLSNDKDIMIWSFHHIILDGWSSNIVLDEVFKTYKQLCKGVAIRLPKRRPYGDYIAWLKKQNDESNFWKQYVSGTKPISLIKNPTPHEKTEYMSEFCKLGGFSKIENFCKTNGITINTFLLGILGIAISYDRKDIVIGVTTSGRTIDLSGIDNMIGLFINTFPVRIRMANNSLLKYFTKLQSELQKIAEHGHAALPNLFSIHFIYENYPMSKQNSGIKLLHLQEQEKTEYPVSIIGYKEENNLLLKCDYQTKYFDDIVITDVLKRAKIILQESIRDPYQKTHKISIISMKNQDVNTEHIEYTDGKFIHKLFEEQVKKIPDAVAVEFQNLSITYTTLNEKANQIAHFLLKQGLKIDQPIGICIHKKPEVLACMLGILKAGGAYIPLDYLWPKARIDNIKNENNLYIITEDFIKNNEVWRGEKYNPDVSISLKNLAYIIYTSGSTGQPKGVQITHEGLSNYVIWGLRYYGNDTRPVLLHGSFNFDMAVTSIYLPLISGRKIIIKDEIEYNHELSLLKITPSHLQTLIEDNKTEIGSVIIGGEKLSKTMADKAKKCLNARHFYNEYGPTETTVASSVYDFSSHKNGDISIGTPILNSKIYILDQNLNVVPRGIAGEICISGRGLARGYTKRPAQTAEKFIANPFENGSRLYRTGDIGVLSDDKNIKYLGRMDEQVKIRGFRVELGEVTAAINDCSDVKACVVLSVECNESNQLIACVIPKNVSLDREILLSKIREQLESILPNYMIPGRVVLLKKFPLNANGKVDKILLRKELLAHQNLADVSTRNPSYDAEQNIKTKRNEEKSKVSSSSHLLTPQKSTIQFLTEIWKEILQLDDVGINDNFFKIGGDSISAIRVFARLKNNVQTKGLLKLFFENPTIYKFAKVLQNIEKKDKSTDIYSRKDGVVPLSPMQRRLWIVDKLIKNKSLYNVSMAMRLTGKINFAALNKAFNFLLHRHEGLRTKFIEKGENVRQVVIESDGIPIKRKKSQNLKEDILQEAKKEFDLLKFPLIRAVLWHRATENILQITVHHIIFDGWSANIFWNELARAYEFFVKNEEPNFKPLKVSYIDYIRNSQLDPQHMKEALQYWKKYLLASPKQIKWQTDHKRPEEMKYSGDSIKKVLSKKLYQKIKELSIKYDSSVFMVLVAVVFCLLHRFTQNSDIVIGVPANGRDDPDAEKIIGFFVKTILLRSQVGRSSTFSEILEKTRNDMISAFQNDDMPFEYLVNNLKIERQANVNPLFQVMVTIDKKMLDKTVAGLHCKPIDFALKTSKFDLTFMWTETSNETLELTLEYSTEIFKKKRMLQLLSCLDYVIESILDNEHVKLMSEIPFNNESDIFLEEGNLVTHDYIPPRTEVESKLCGILQEVLQMDHIGIYDDFFKLGGDSILAIQVASKAKKKKLDISVLDIMKNKTIAAVCENRNKEPFEIIEYNFGYSTTLQHGIELCRIYNQNNQETVFLFPPLDGNYETYHNLLFELRDKKLVLFNNVLNYYSKWRKIKSAQIMDELTYEKISLPYVEYISKMQSREPIILFGWCSGGLLAFEVYRQLLNLDMKNCKLMLIDTFFNYKKAVAMSGYLSAVNINLNYNEEIKQKANITLFKMKQLDKNDPNAQLYSYYINFTSDNHICDYINFDHLKLININSSHTGWLGKLSILEKIHHEI